MENETKQLNNENTAENTTNHKKSCKHSKLNSWLSDSDKPKLMKTSKWLGTVLFFTSIVIYVLLGCLMHNWAKTWMIFIFVPVIPSLLVSIAKRKLNLFGITFLITGIYCAIGMNMGMWHPTWAMFFGIILYHAIATWIDKEVMSKKQKEIQKQ